MKRGLVYVSPGDDLPAAIVEATARMNAPLHAVVREMAPGVLLERAPHREVRTTVDREGVDSVRALYEAFDEFNRAHFNGALREPMILVTAPSSARSLGDHCDRDVHGLRSVIRLSPRVLDRGMLFARDVLLHEMIHTWQGEIILDQEEGYRGHGPQFANRCNTIGGKLELPAVSPKGRGGRPDCAQWPVNVRPPGYYGTDAGEADRVKRTTRKTPKPKPDDVVDEEPDDELEAPPPLPSRRMSVKDRMALLLAVDVLTTVACDAGQRTDRGRELTRAAELVRVWSGAA